MIVQCGKRMISITALCTLVVIGMNIWGAWYTGEIKESILVCLLFLIIPLRMWVVYGRRLVMDVEGCEVRFLCFRKKYLWKELKVCRREHYKSEPGWDYRNRSYYNDGVVFCKYRIRKLATTDPDDYGMRRHCFSFFFVQFAFDPEVLREIDKGGKSPQIYEVDEDEFLQKMEEWHIEIEDTRRKYLRRKKS